MKEFFTDFHFDIKLSHMEMLQQDLSIVFQLSSEYASVKKNGVKVHKYCSLSHPFTKKVITTEGLQSKLYFF